MKNRKFGKIALLVLSLVLVIGATFAMTISADETETKTPVIESQNVAYTDKFALMYAVDASTVNEAPVTLYLYEEDPSTGASPIRTYQTSQVVAASGNLTIDTYQFTTAGVAATAMTENYYVQVEDATGAKSAVKRYSVAEYLYERLASSDITTEQVNFYNSSIAFGSSAQKVIGKVTDSTQYVNYYRYVKVEGGTIDGYSAGVYPIGTVLTPDDTTTNWCVIAYDSIGDFEVNLLNDDGTFTVADGVLNKLTTKVINYRDDIDTMNSSALGTMSFDDSTRLTSDGRFYRANGTPSIEYVNAGDHGVAAKFDISDAGQTVKIMPTDTTYTSDTATAFECSFDIKASVSCSESYQPIEIRFLNGTSSRFRMNLYINYNGSGQLVVGSPNNSNMVSKHYDQDPTDWFHVRAVIYANDLTTAYFYINDNEVGHANNYAGVTVDFANIGFSICQYTAGYYSKEVTVKDEDGNIVYDEDGNEVKEKVWYGNSDDEVTVLIDNYFCGYTMEDNPYVTTTEDTTTE